MLPRGGPARAGTAEASAPSPGPASLTVDQQIHLGTSSSLFLEGSVLLWTDDTNTALGRAALGGNESGSSNTALGSQALISNSTGMFNTAVGDSALAANFSGVRNTAVGGFALNRNKYGSYNTAVGVAALEYHYDGPENTAVGHAALALNTDGWFNTAVGAFALLSSDSDNNTAVGARALFSNSSGNDNVAVGGFALYTNTTGWRNLALGSAAGYYTDGSDNVLIQSPGVDGENNVLRIGKATGTGYYELDKAFIHGINGNTIAAGSAVYIDTTTSQLGTAPISARHLKTAIEPMGQTSLRLRDLEPVTFRFKDDVVGESMPLQFGLIAEDVAEVLPELVVFDENGKPLGVQYRLLTPLLLNEVQRQHRQIQVLQIALGLTLLVGLGWIARTELRVK